MLDTFIFRSVTRN